MFYLIPSYVIGHMSACGSFVRGKSVSSPGGNNPSNCSFVPNGTKKAKWAVLLCTSALSGAPATLGRLLPGCKVRLRGVREVTAANAKC